MTPLHFAAIKRHNKEIKEIVELLIAKGADVNAKTDDGGTPLNAAIFAGSWADETADLLRKHGGKTEIELDAAGN